jgi:hypothetical protein
MRSLIGSLRLSRGVVMIGAVVLAVACTGTVLADPGGIFGGGGTNPWPYNTPTTYPVLAAVGDISCQPDANNGAGETAGQTCSGGVTPTYRNQAQNATAVQVEGMQPGLVALLGDEQYQNGYYEDFEGSFDKYWGAFKFLERPSPGNHEFYTNKNQTGVLGYGYFDYFNGFQHNAADGSEVDSFPNGVKQPTPMQNGQAGPFTDPATQTTGDGWYSYNLGSWHIISLNIECATQEGGCSTTGKWFSAETQWLTNDLKQDHSTCTLAYWHQPTFSSTHNPWTQDSTEGALADTWWQLLYQNHATLILNGHDHVYSRFAPMNPDGKADPRNGIREFIVGTGGESLDKILPATTPNLEAYTDQYYGVLKLTLKPTGYDWDYKSALPATATTMPPSYEDAGSASCNGVDTGNNDGNSQS